MASDSPEETREQRAKAWEGETAGLLGREGSSARSRRPGPGFTLRPPGLENRTSASPRGWLVLGMSQLADGSEGPMSGRGDR